MRNEETFKPTLGKPINKQSQGFEKNFKKTMNQYNVKLNETDELLTEKEQSLKKKIFNLAKMEALVFSDPKLLAVYNEMSVNGEEKYGYHYNETIMNMLFNDYVLNSPKYLQKYKMAIPKEKKRRDQSGINQLRKAGKEIMKKSEPKPLAQTGLKPEVTESDNEKTKILFLVNEKDPENPDVFAYFPEENFDSKGEYKTAYSHIGQHSAVHPNYAEESRPATPEEYQDLKTELESIGYNLNVLNSTNETTGAASAGAFAPALGYEKKVEETTTAGSAGGAAGYVGYAGPSAWGDGDLMKTKGKSNIMRKPIWKGGTIIQEGNYLIDPSGFEKYVNVLNEQFDRGKEIDFIGKTSDAYGTETNNMPNKDINTIDTDIKTGQLDKPNLNVMEQDGIDNTINKNEKMEKQPVNEKAVSKSQQRFMGMVHAVQKGELSPEKVGSDVEKAAASMSKNDAEDFASTKHKKLPEKVKEETQTMIQSNNTSMSNKANPTGELSSTMDVGTKTMNESDIKLLEEINDELNAYSVHHNKLKNMSEERKPSALVLRDRLGSENEVNFKKDLQHSVTKDVIDVEKELQWKDQQTDVGKDPQKLGQDIEKKEIKITDAESDEALKNVGDSANDKGDEIPKRNLTKDEQDEVNMYRLGQQSLVYDNEPGKRFEDRMKKDMGDKLYDQRQKQLKFRGKAPMYNKDPQPVEDTTSDKVQFNKEQTGWSEREGIKESMITGRFVDALGKKFIMDFRLNEAKIVDDVKEVEEMFKLDFTGFGNKYKSKAQNKKVSINEGVESILSENKYYTDGKKIFVLKNPVQKLNENEHKEEKPVINEQFNKMKHLLGYKPNDFIDTKNVKKNRGF